MRNSLLTMLQFECEMLYWSKTIIIWSDIPKCYNITLATQCCVKTKIRIRTFVLSVSRINITDVEMNENG